MDSEEEDYLAQNEAIDSDSNQHDNESNCLPNWRPHEKKKLLYSLRTHSSKQIEIISQEIPTKTIEEITHAIDHYKSRSLILFSDCNKEIKSIPQHDSATQLTHWINILRNSLTSKDLQNEISKAVRIISEYETIVKPDNNNDVDFSKIYAAIANALEGKPLPEFNRMTRDVLRKCLYLIHRQSKGFVNIVRLEECLPLLENPQDFIMSRPSCTNDIELTTLEHLTTQRSYNPFGIATQDNMLLKNDM